MSDAQEKRRLKTAAYIESKTTAELAADLSKNLQQYRVASVEPDSTQSIPNLDHMCDIAEALEKRLNK